MTGEAREAALVAERAKFTDPPAESKAFVAAHMIGYERGRDDGHAAGVAEGIRQAREAVATKLAIPAISSSPAVLGVVDSLAAIDALEVER